MWRELVRNLKEFFFRNELNNIRKLKLLVKESNLRVVDLENSRSALAQSCDNYRKMVKVLEKKFSLKVVELKKCKENDSVSDEIITEYPSAKVFYNGRPFPKNPNRHMPIDVRLFVTPQDYFIKEDLKKWGLLQLVGKESWETLAVKIYKKVMAVYGQKYDSDEHTHSSPEFWNLPFETRNLIIYKETTGNDCEDLAHLIVSYLRCAGMPVGYVWVVYGSVPESFGGFGHSSVYVYSLEDKKMHHLNSTSKRPKYLKVSEYPIHEDARNDKDQMGIAKVYASFNDKIARTGDGNTIEIQKELIEKVKVDV